MQKIKNILVSFSAKWPFLFSILVVGAMLALTELPLTPILEPILGKQNAYYYSVGLQQTLAAALLLGLLKVLGLYEMVGFRRPVSWRSLLLGWPILMLTLVNSLDNMGLPNFARPLTLGLFVLVVLSTGLFEEVLCRGVGLFVLLRKWGSTRRGIYAAVLASSSLFGVAHLVNLITGRYSLLANLTQMAFALFFGVFFCALLLRSRSIWPAVVLHALFDMAGSFKEIIVGGGLRTAAVSITPQDALVSILLTLPLCLYGLFILRKVQPLTISPAEPAAASGAASLLYEEKIHA